MSDIAEFFDVRHIGGGEITEAWVTEMITKLCTQNAEDLTARIEGKVDVLTKAFDQWSSNGGMGGGQPKEIQPEATLSVSPFLLLQMMVV